MGAIEIIKLVLAILPLIVEAVKTIEALFPQSGQGAIKKAMVMQMIEKSDPESFKRAAVALDGIVDKTVMLMNASSEIKK